MNNREPNSNSNSDSKDTINTSTRPARPPRGDATTTDKKDTTTTREDKNTPPKRNDPSASTVTVIPDPLNEQDKFATVVDGQVDLAKQALIIK